MRQEKNEESLPRADAQTRIRRVLVAGLDETLESEGLLVTGLPGLLGRLHDLTA
ncbi:MAG: hypothetical protein JW993_10720 [Sedimentisphaerales bacterium]|nr:hypothetical protein [Sedimentisphaerales bacterium]